MKPHFLLCLAKGVEVMQLIRCIIGVVEIYGVYKGLHDLRLWLMTYRS